MTLAERLSEIHQRIHSACDRSGRPVSDVKLLAVSKTFSSSDILEAFESGQRDFGESRQQEAATKIPELPDGICWHFIGRVQRNKVRKILGDFSVVHGVDSLRLAKYIDRIAEELNVKPDIYLQVDIAGEENKGGFPPETLTNEIQQISSLTHVNVAGLMAIPPYADDPENTRKWFKKMHKFRDELQAQSCIELPGLSMGMSGDYEVAIEEGSTIVRIGSAIFGERDYSK